ncbi:TetR/AcrR family transcriptional regulator [Salidesulfovibrio onnuriiensis]|uniref:TetR/AcrR family transcriptional regulator n=1 Tax=Salidesulfovibrio onnuriiensis TaxID=2583823 RepID=UPI0011C7D1D0|nr:TetR/AcrR family transcriptional regulator [Salidesulfovibrio onnuriiensis]
MTKAGRPRSEQAREAILNATQALLKESQGAGLTIEAIARRAKVGKPTIYRWWPTLADVVLEALLCQADANITIPPFESLQKTLRHILRLSVKAIADGAGVHLRFLMAQAQQDEAFRERFRKNFTAKRRAVLKSIFMKAVEHGNIGPDQDLDMLTDVVFGVMWYRLLTGHAPMDETFADKVTGMVMKMVQPLRA